MEGMFVVNEVFNQDISGWDTSQVTNMEWMFSGATAFNQDISGWDTSSLKLMRYMFDPDNRCTAFTGYDSACATGYMHNGVLTRCAGNTCADSDFSATGSCCRRLFKPADSTALTAAVAACAYAYGTCLDANGDSYGVIGDWDVSLVTSMFALFSGLGLFNEDISKWDTSAVTDFSYMFDSASAFNQDISDWNTGKATTMSYMFRRTNSFNQDISKWKTGAVTDFEGMFSEGIAFNQDISGWDTSSLTTSARMFQHTPYQVCTAYTASACPGGYTNKGVFARCAGAACADSDFLATGSCCAPL
jgi:surface protein